MLLISLTVLLNHLLILYLTNQFLSACISIRIQGHSNEAFYPTNFSLIIKFASSYEICFVLYGEAMLQI